MNSFAFRLRSLLVSEDSSTDAELSRRERVHLIHVAIDLKYS